MQPIFEEVEDLEDEHAIEYPDLSKHFKEIIPLTTSLGVFERGIDMFLFSKFLSILLHFSYRTSQG
jgi:hypothetical protein